LAPVIGLFDDGAGEGGHPLHDGALLLGSCGVSGAQKHCRSHFGFGSFASWT